MNDVTSRRGFTLSLATLGAGEFARLLRAR